MNNNIVIIQKIWEIANKIQGLSFANNKAESNTDNAEHRLYLATRHAYKIKSLLLDMENEKKQIN